MAPQWEDTRNLVELSHRACMERRIAPSSDAMMQVERETTIFLFVKVQKKNVFFSPVECKNAVL